jgi:ABC-type methionine transport system ATPase subunit
MRVMANKMVHLIFPQKLIKKPVIYTMAKKYNVIPNIRRAKVTEKIGEVTLELSGSKETLQKARRYLEKQGIKVEPVVGDIVE